MESLVARIEEISEERQKLSVWNQGPLTNSGPQGWSSKLFLIYIKVGPLNLLQSFVSFRNRNVKNCEIWVLSHPRTGNMWCVSQKVTFIECLSSSPSKDFAQWVEPEPEISCGRGCLHRVYWSPAQGNMALTCIQAVQFRNCPVQTWQSLPWRWSTSLWPSQHSFAQAEPWDYCQRT